jgi:hypothetical protein
MHRRPNIRLLFTGQAVARVAGIAGWALQESPCHANVVVVEVDTGDGEDWL